MALATVQYLWMLKYKHVINLSYTFGWFESLGGLSRIKIPKCSPSLPIAIEQNVS